MTIAAEHFATLGIEVACSTKDKDLKQYPWKTFVDMNTDTVYSISESQAHRNLWKQMLIGDVKVDNIPGLSHAAKYGTPGEFNSKVRGSKDHLLGAKGAEDLLDLWSPEDYFERTYELYLMAYDEDRPNTAAVHDICYKNNWTFGEYRFYETWDLIHMLLVIPDGVDIHYDYLPVPEGSKPRMSNEFHDMTEEDL